MSDEITAAVSCFGKLPGADDFIKAAGDDPQLIAWLDRWAGGALALLARGAMWERLYDRSAPIHFALLGSRRRRAVVGHLRPSADASGRRFPFITALAMDIPRPLHFLSRSPLAFSRVWATLEGIANEAHGRRDPAAQLRSLIDTPIHVHAAAEALDSAFHDLLQTHTIGTLEALLDDAGRPVSVRRILMALGVLMQPTIGTGFPQAARGLALPLPADPPGADLVACLWLDLISGFLVRVDFDLLLLFRHAEPALLAVGFNGLQSGDLQALFDPDSFDARYVPLYDPGWAEAHAADAGLRKLATYAENENLSLRTARHTFRETFLGA